MSWCKSVVGTVLLMMLAVGWMASGCAISESADEDERAQATAVAPEDGDGVSSETPSEQDRLAESGADISREEPVDMEAKLADSRLDLQHFSRIVDEGLDDAAATTIGGLGLLPDSDRCDGQPCQYCELGTEFGFALPEHSVAVRGCCVSESSCISELYFDPSESSIAVVNGALEAGQLSGDGRHLVISTRARSGTDEEIFFVGLEDLQSMARPVDEGTPVVSHRELKGASQWELDADHIHRFQALPARALDEARGDCEAGYSLERLVALSEGASPIDEDLEIVFKGWDEQGRVEMSTTSSGGGETQLFVDPNISCMERYDARSR